MTVGRVGRRCPIIVRLPGEVGSGIELSTTHADQEIHLLVISSDSGTPVLNEHLTRFVQRQQGLKTF